MAAQPQTVLPLHRLDVDTYNRIIDSGALEERHVELLDGVLVDMSPQSPGHSLVVTRLMRHFAVAPRWWTRVQMPLEIRPDSEPEPDLAVLDAEPSPNEHPHTALVAIEVATTSQMIDRNLKATKYAAAAIPTYWLVDIPARTIEIRTSPGPGGYIHCEIYTEPAIVSSPLKGVPDLDVASLFAGVTG